MKTPWTQPSLSRDFALLAAAILFVLFLISLWVSYSTYLQHSSKVARLLEEESARVEYVLKRDINQAGYLLTAVGRQLTLADKLPTHSLAAILKTYENQDSIFSTFSFINPSRSVIVSSNRGVLDQPVDVSDRDYVVMSENHPWELQVGDPIDGRVSGRWVIPVSMGITDYTGRFIGSVVASLDIDRISNEIEAIIHHEGTSFAIISKDLVPLTEVAEEKQFVLNHFPARKLLSSNLSVSESGIIGRGNLFIGSSLYTYYRVVRDYPFIILLGYDSQLQDESVRAQLWSRLLQVLGFAVFFVLFLWIMRARMIRPVQALSEAAAEISKGRPMPALVRSGSQEIESLATEIASIGNYTAELGRIEDEMRNKLFKLRQHKQLLEMQQHSHSEFLSYLCEKLRAPLSVILSSAQAMKDQIYGPIENRRYRQFAHDMHHQGQHLMSELSDLIAFSKAHTNYVSRAETACEIEHAIEQAMQSVLNRLQHRSVHIDTDIPANPPQLLMNEFRLQQLFSNLLQHYFDSAAEKKIIIRVHPPVDSRDKNYLAVDIGYAASGDSLPPPSAVQAIEAITVSERYKSLPEDVLEDDINLNLARILVSENELGLLHRSAEGRPLISRIYFNTTRIIERK